VKEQFLAACVTNEAETSVTNYPRDRAGFRHTGTILSVPLRENLPEAIIRSAIWQSPACVAYSSLGNRRSQDANGRQCGRRCSAPGFVPEFLSKAGGSHAPAPPTIWTAEMLDQTLPSPDANTRTE
jgi:hypothetical protein